MVFSVSVLACRCFLLFGSQVQYAICCDIHVCVCVFLVLKVFHSLQYIIYTHLFNTYFIPFWLYFTLPCYFVSPELDSSGKKMSDSDGEMPPLEDDLTSPPQPTPTLHMSPTPNPAPVLQVSLTHDDCEGSSDDDDSDWLEMEDEGEEKGSAICLFCESREKNTTTCLAHMLDSHGFDLVAFVCRAGLEQVGYIKLVNYLRATKHSPEELLALKGTPWDDDTHLTPVLRDDLLLMFGKTVTE